MDLATSVAKEPADVILLCVTLDQPGTAKQSITTKLHLERLVMEERPAPKENQVLSN